jgi:hypothetical protein
MFVCIYVCLFVCLYLIQIHISAPIGTKLCTRLPRGLEETVGYVWTHNILPSPPIRRLPSRRPAWRCAKMAAEATVGGDPPKLYIRDSGTWVVIMRAWKRVVRRKRGEGNGIHACKRGNQVTLRGAEWLHWLSNPHSHVRVCVCVCVCVASTRVYIAGMRVYMWPSFCPVVWKRP